MIAEQAKPNRSIACSRDTRQARPFAGYNKLRELSVAEFGNLVATEFKYPDVPGTVCSDVAGRTAGCGKFVFGHVFALRDFHQLIAALQGAPHVSLRIDRHAIRPPAYRFWYIPG